MGTTIGEKKNWSLLAPFSALIVTDRLKPSHPRLAKILNYTVGSIHFGAAGWNVAHRMR